MAKVWKTPQPKEQTKHHYSFPIPKHENKPTQLFYSLFEKKDGKWTRVSIYQYPEKFAYKVWGQFIVRNCLSFSIRKVSFTCDAAQFKSRFNTPHYNVNKEMVQSDWQTLTDITIR